MAVKVYEGMFILDAKWYSSQSAAASNYVHKIIENAGGKLLASRLWEERRLEYPIKGYRRGAYWLTYFKIDSSKVEEIYHTCELSEKIIRSLILKVDPKIVDPLVEHAKSAAVPSRKSSTRDTTKQKAETATAVAEVPAGETKTDETEEK